MPDGKQGESQGDTGRKLTSIPVRGELVSSAAGACEDGGIFALQVLGDAMVPEFDDGDVIVAEVDGQLTDGAFVVARSDEEWVLRQLVQRDAGWVLLALNASWPERPVYDLSVIRGVVIQKSRPGRRSTIKRYV